MTTTLDPLFVFGTLMDEDVLRCVSDMDVCELIRQPAVVKGVKRRPVKSENFPVLLPFERGWPALVILVQAI